MTMTAEEIATEIAKAPLTIEEKLGWHFANFDLPIPQTLIPVAVRAIEIANDGGDLQTILTLPTGIKFQGEQHATAEEVIEGHYLHFYLNKE